MKTARFECERFTGVLMFVLFNQAKIERSGLFRKTLEHGDLVIDIMNVYDPGPAIDSACQDFGVQKVIQKMTPDLILNKHKITTFPHQKEDPKMSTVKYVLLGLITLSFLGYSGLIAGTTGKIAGHVYDAETREPLPGANIMVEGTGRGDASNIEGDFSILNLPPGKYTLIVSMMGYTRTRVENVDVNIDMTTTQDIYLSSGIIEGEEVTVVAERPLVRRDMTSALSSVGSDEIENLPVQEVRDVLELQAGIVRSGNALHIRGGRSGETAYWIDGVAATDVYSGSMGINVENSAIEELQVVSGTFNAEYGQAMSGIINIITKEGSPEYTGQVRSYIGDYVSNAPEFRVMDRVETMVDSETGAVRQVPHYENPLEALNPTYNIEASLSGPVPGLGKRLTFFANGRYFDEEGHLYGKRWFTPIGSTGDSASVPLSPHRRSSLQGKLTWRVSNSIKTTYNVFWNDWKNERSFSKNWKYVPDSRPQSFGSAVSNIFTLNHILSQNTFYELRVNRFENNTQSYLFEDPAAVPHYLVSVGDDSVNGIVSHSFDPTTPEGRIELQKLRDLRVPFTYYPDPNGPMGYVHPNSVSAPATYSFNDMGTHLGRFRRGTTYWIGKFDLTSQVSRVHQVKTGFEFRQHELMLDSYTLRRKLQDSGAEVVPFEPEIPPTSSIYHDKYTRRPREISAYVQDKIELQEIILNLGLRFDYFDPNHVQIADPSDPSIHAPFKAVHIYKNPAAPEDERIEYTADERRAFMHKGVDAKMQLSPRLGIAYPITDQGVIHFSYGHFFQIPEFRYLYSNPDFKLSKGSGYFIFGNADLQAQRTVMYEIGLQQQLTRDVGFDVTLFYRDVRNWVGTSPLINTPNPQVKYSQYENKDYSNVRGVTLKLEKRHSRNVSMRLDYSFQVAEGTYSNPNDAFNAAQAQEEPRLNLLPLNWDQNHTLNGSVIWDIQDWTFSMIGRFWTGRPYTPSFARGEVVGGSALIGLRENSERLPNQKSVDLYINRRFKIRAMHLNLFFNIYNLFDIQDETAVYGDTGSAEYTTNIDPSRVTYDEDRISVVEDYVVQPGWYTAPRQIQLGFALEF